MRRYTAGAVLALLAAGLILGSGSRPAAAPSAVGTEAPAQPMPVPNPGTQPDAFFEAQPFWSGLREAQASLVPLGEGALVGGLVPHHALAGVMLSHLFIELEAHPPSTVIVVGPNHENRGQRAITGRRGWATPFGVVKADRELADQLIGSGLAVADEDALATEHSIGTIMPYLKHHAPGARVLPLILHGDIALSEVRRLAANLAPLLGPDRILVASVDFSHYLTRAEAEQKDEVTLEAIRAFDLEGLRRLGDDHLDSPGALTLLMLAMEQFGAAGPELVAHTNSGILLGNDLIETTSYFTFTYRLAR